MSDLRYIEWRWLSTQNDSGVSKVRTRGRRSPPWGRPTRRRDPRLKPADHSTEPGRRCKIEVSGSGYVCELFQGLAQLPFCPISVRKLSKQQLDLRGEVC